ncbi:hypothetical protein, partial [Mycolicibacterium aurum]|uniref:hypothetical protein n=1 Tax=Mycolicibacterium aurum TaxID=1791 RepID=UPI0021F3B870
PAAASASAVRPSGALRERCPLPLRQVHRSRRPRGTRARPPHRFPLHRWKVLPAFCLLGPARRRARRWLVRPAW